ncbi:GTP-binding protein [Apophysomyces ossiformis]|uniref:GTP-binding protein n=1 Tax=Apophysomyces ossiformis TaxID=679940 RepID=A0A8H7BM22_9FUNG|nr:GTP-binding protein [Apophysomyces ossiformis]
MSLTQRWMPMLSMVRRSMATGAAAAAAKPLSNRQKFNQIQPPRSLYDKLERLGFGALRRTNRFVKMHKAKDASKKNDMEKSPDPVYTFPLLSFFAGAQTPASFPPETLGEVGFVGRSNVGKSTLLNHLADTNIVRTSDKPGLTQQINFFSVGRLFFMVDMPGYGFAFVDEEKRQQWRQLMETYISTRKTLKRIFVVIDARHGLKLADLEFLKMLDSKQVKFQIVMTKSDLQVLPTLAKRVVTVQEKIKAYNHAIKDVLVVSSKSGAGINQMRKEMLFLMGHLRPKDFYENKTK